MLHQHTYVGVGGRSRHVCWLRNASQVRPAEGKCKKAIPVVAYRTVLPRFATQCLQCRANEVCACAGSSADTKNLPQLYSCCNVIRLDVNSPACFQLKSQNCTAHANAFSTYHAMHFSWSLVCRRSRLHVTFHKAVCVEQLWPGRKASVLFQEEGCRKWKPSKAQHDLATQCAMCCSINLLKSLQPYLRTCFSTRSHSPENRVPSVDQV